MLSEGTPIAPGYHASLPYNPSRSPHLNLQAKKYASSFRAVVLIGVAAACTGFLPHIATPSLSVASKRAEASPGVLPPQWLPVLLASDPVPPTHRLSGRTVTTASPMVAVTGRALQSELPECECMDTWTNPKDGGTCAAEQHGCPAVLHSCDTGGPQWCMLKTRPCTPSRKDLARLNAVYAAIGAVLLNATYTVISYTWMYCHNAFTSTAQLRTALLEYDANATTATTMYDAIADWDVSAITSMNGLFKELTNINADISDWNTSGVTDMSNMFGVRPDL